MRAIMAAFFLLMAFCDLPGINDSFYDASDPLYASSDWKPSRWPKFRGLDPLGEKQREAGETGPQTGVTGFMAGMVAAALLCLPGLFEYFDH